MTQTLPPASAAQAPVVPNTNPPAQALTPTERTPQTPQTATVQPDSYSTGASTKAGASAAGMATSFVNAIRVEFGRTMEGRAGAFTGMRGLARFAGATGPFAGVA